MPLVPRRYAASEIAGEAGCPEDRVRWLSDIGLLTPDGEGTFSFGDVLATKMVSALLESGLPAETLERAVADGFLSFQRTDEYLPYQPGPLSTRTFAEFQASAGPGAELLPAVFEVSGPPEARPGLADPRRRGGPVRALPRGGEESCPTRTHRSAPHVCLRRERARRCSGGRISWTSRSRGRCDSACSEASSRSSRTTSGVASMRVTNLVPEMFTWLSSRFLEHRSVNGIVEGFERFLASRGLAPPPAPDRPPAIVFVDLSGFTRLTRDAGDESAVIVASSLQEHHADATATRHGGRLVKLLGDGAMLRLNDATVGVEAALDLVGTMSGEGALSSHAGVHTGPVIERDLDVFGQTVNLASRIADAASPGEVLASEAVAEAAGDGAFAFERIREVALKGIPELVPLFRVTSRTGA